jgi:glycosyltransferase involved in cell wall biosynthesis
MPSAAERVQPETCDVSVNVCTYNRHQLLREALESIVGNEIGAGVQYEVIVVDNNSTDQTPQVVQSFIERGHSNVRYVFEGRQGLSYARNAGIATARSNILAFTDDDVRVSANWVTTIKRSLDSHPEVDCIGGKVLPSWSSPPPSWLTSDHWAPVGIADYGDQPFYVNAGNRLCLITANMAFRKQALERIGKFQPQLQRVQDSLGSMEDHELLIRLWNANGQGLYVPQLVVTSQVVSERLTKSYHRRWHLGHGRFYSMARVEEMERSRRGWLFDVPAHMYKQAVLAVAAWLRHLLRGDRDRAFVHETALMFFAGFFQRRYEDFRNRGERGRLGEIGRFVRTLMRRLLRLHVEA